MVALHRHTLPINGFVGVCSRAVSWRVAQIRAVGQRHARCDSATIALVVVTLVVILVAIASERPPVCDYVVVTSESAAAAARQRVRACVRAFVRAFVRASVRLCVSFVRSFCGRRSPCCWHRLRRWCLCRYWYLYAWCAWVSAECRCCWLRKIATIFLFWMRLLVCLVVGWPPLPARPASSFSSLQVPCTRPRA